MVKDVYEDLDKRNNEFVTMTYKTITQRLKGTDHKSKSMRFTSKHLNLNDVES